MSGRGAMHSSVSRAITPGFLPLKEAATWAGISSKTLKRWIESGLPKYQAGPGSKVLIRPGDIEAYLTRHKTARHDLDVMVNEVFQDLRKQP